MTDAITAPDFRSNVLHFLYFHFLFLLAILCNLVILLGPFLYPGTIGLFLALPYVSYTFITKLELKNGNPWPWFSQNFFVLNHARRTLQLDFVDFPPHASTRQYLYACHPHGVYSDYRVLIDGMFRHRAVSPKTLAATILFRLPLIREVSLWTGCVDARRQVAEATLHRGDSVLVLPGGEAEQIRTKFGREIVYLKHRKGFIKLAMRKGVPVVPMYVFGVSDYYYTSDVLLGPRMWLTKNLQICIPFAAGLAWSPFCPLPQKTTVVFGEPLSFEPSCESPTAEQLDSAHGAFVDALSKLFDEHKDRLGYGDRKLEIV
jgi:1-acyl-sn-glycerol-3-phosphate acyltransferase